MNAKIIDNPLISHEIFLEFYFIFGQSLTVFLKRSMLSYDHAKRNNRI